MGSKETRERDVFNKKSEVPWIVWHCWTYGSIALWLESLKFQILILCRKAMHMLNNYIMHHLKPQYKVWCQCNYLLHNNRMSTSKIWMLKIAQDYELVMTIIILSSTHHRRMNCNYTQTDTAFFFSSIFFILFLIF